MKRIPADIDQLMWTLAEADDARAVEDFEQRFPEMKYELGKRILVVRELRGARRGGARSEVPHFEPRAPAEAPWQRPAWAAVGILTLAVVALASYSLTKSFIRSSPGSAPSPVVRPVDQPGPLDVRGSQPVPNHTEPEVREEDLAPAAYNQKLTIKIDRAPLLQAIQQVGDRAGLQLEIAPGMDNPDVAMEYTDMSGLAILEDMGKQLGFTPFYESDGKVLIVPAVDPKKRMEPSKARGTTQVVEDAAAAKTKGTAPPKEATRSAVSPR